MTPYEYQKLAECTENKNLDVIAERLANHGNIRLLHAAFGLETEAGEFTDALKKAFFYGKPLDRVNLAEEVGDTLWYLALACNELGIDMEDVMKRNIAKLKARYPNNFSEDSALNRDLKTERAILEQ